MGAWDLQIDNIYQDFTKETPDYYLKLNRAWHGEEVDLKLLRYLQFKVGPSQKSLFRTSNIVTVDYQSDKGTDLYDIITPSNFRGRESCTVIHFG